MVLSKVVSPSVSGGSKATPANETVPMDDGRPEGKESSKLQSPDPV